ncbi:ferredoxin-type protein NapG [Campylobacter sputorum]|uniref:ferredoxin-type protein NapG n=1 Tax=Campylobacter sputorum TaxID=206 RepID=UPI000B787C21|nr:ferredoxin-type protein NapG [Campylobacter sputorum]ASM36421.1 menaquinol dehydrogenase NapGH, periplasmic component NapG [Campylobacter sputorum bv. faecalis CCUG 20703]
MQRREALKKGFKIASLLLCGGFIWSVGAKGDSKVFLRPPGALKEQNFISKCIKCGLCVEACPYNTLKLASINHSAAIGTPFFMPRNIPCYMCEDIPCAEICPTGALDINLLKTNGKLDIKKSKMGVAIVDDKTCVAYWGIQCDICYRACPVMDKALFLDYKHNERTSKHAFLLPVIDSTYCTGCGKCERACITKKASISVIPREFVIGKSNDNYVKGWIEGADKKLKDADTKIYLDKKETLDYLNSENLQ